MSVKVLGVGDMAVSRCPSDVLATYALGSCVGVALVDSYRCMAGLAHVALPDSRINPQKGQEQPGYFADTALEALLKEMAPADARLHPATYDVYLVGGADLRLPNDVFQIGRANLNRLDELFKYYGVRVAARDVGGTRSRTLKLFVGTGTLHLSTPGLPVRALQ
ncbi:CheD, stimulates methylation of MCP protein [Desulfohalobium retbaense DSM 5692]|uniref:Probable chemoreceptor glutamine deamidase CheD n=2 Tax=Desulfohalobium TaxID=45662 RepID=C8X0L4_DESRD|nr:CheD, stimulates methylation of MCP protein [Desulfohalobium retbaense DSM 5692]